LTKDKAIFLSYSSDDTEVAARLCEALRSAGLEVWFDQSELRGGDVWDSSIRDQIKQCAVFIPVISASTQKRSEGYFRLEWKLAIDRSYLMAEDKAFLFPVVIDETQERQARVPDRFRQLQWTKLGDDGSMASFARHVRDALGGGGQPVSPSHSQSEAPAPATEKPPAAPQRPASDSGFWVAVLPFRVYGSDPDLEALSEGFAEDIIVGLSRFSYLRVMGRSATEGILGGAADARELGNRLKARYLLMGSLRRAGSAIRVSAQLVDSTTGVSLWAEHYDRPFSQDSVFELQDELVPRIVSTVADVNGVLARSLNEAARGRPAEDLNPYEALLRSFDYFWRVTPEAFAAARAGLEAALEKAPGHADAWAMLGVLCGQAYGQDFGVDEDLLAVGESAARKAIELAPSSHWGYFSLAQVLFFRKEFESFRIAAYKSAALNPMDGNSIAFMGELLAYTGDLEKGRELAAAAKELNPHHPGWYWYTDFYFAFREGDYREALSCVLKVNLPEQWAYHFFLAAAYGQLGEAAAGAKALKKLIQLRPDFAPTLRADLERWFESDYVDRLMEGLRKVGLEEV
jgi:TolB-like protein